MKKVMVLILGLFLSVTSFAKSPWESLFESTFYSNTVYEASQCNMNVRRYLRLARKQGLDLKQIQVIELVNKGLNNFGLVAAKNARGDSERDHESNWSHHVFLKLGDLILDYDYTMKPAPTEISRYFQNMYETERMKTDKKRCWDDLGRYQVTIYSGTDYLRYYDEKVLSDTLQKQQFYLKDSKLVCQ